MSSILLKEIEVRNNYLEKESGKLQIERARCSRRASEIQFILMGLKGEMEANKQIIKKLKAESTKVNQVK